jgi:hypothetical protein
MKKIILLVTLFISAACHAQTHDSSTSDSSFNASMAKLSRDRDTVTKYFILGLKNIKHDALWHLRFRKAHDIQQVINQYE